VLVTGESSNVLTHLMSTLEILDDDYVKFECFRMRGLVLSAWVRLLLLGIYSLDCFCIELEKSHHIECH
jgi:hypothetical protein